MARGSRHGSFARPSDRCASGRGRTASSCPTLAKEGRDAGLIRELHPVVNGCGVEDAADAFRVTERPRGKPWAAFGLVAGFVHHRQHELEAAWAVRRCKQASRVALAILDAPHFPGGSAVIRARKRPRARHDRMAGLHRESGLTFVNVALAVRELTLVRFLHWACGVGCLRRAAASPPHGTRVVAPRSRAKPVARAAVPFGRMRAQLRPRGDSETVHSGLVRHNGQLPVSPAATDRQLATCRALDLLCPLRAARASRRLSRRPFSSFSACLPSRSRDLPIRSTGRWLADLALHIALSSGGYASCFDAAADRVC